MVWDVEGTKLRIRAAALEEFAAAGEHGTTIERIARRAGINKERIYNYYGDKTALFTAVTSAQLEKVAAAVPLAVATLDDIGAFAGGAFDYQQDHPDLARLLLWEGLSSTPVDWSERAPLYRAKVTVMAAAQQAGIVTSDYTPAHLIGLLLGLASWWTSTPQLAQVLTDTNPDDDRAARRTAVVRSALRVAAP